MLDGKSAQATFVENETIINNETLVPISIVRWIVGGVVAIAVLVVPWLTITYYKAQKVDAIEDRVQLLEQLGVSTNTRLDNIEPLVRETRDTVVKILTSQSYKER